MQLDDEYLASEASDTTKSRRSQRAGKRTSRACDRCRVKKAKCDGKPLCKQCKISDSTCIYSPRRGRAVQNYYARVYEIADNAIHTLFTACQQNGCFPGDLPQADKNGFISTGAILHALGLVESVTNEQSSVSDLADRSIFGESSSIPGDACSPGGGPAFESQPASVNTSTRGSLSVDNIEFMSVAGGDSKHYAHPQNNHLFPRSNVRPDFAASSTPNQPLHVAYMGPAAYSIDGTTFSAFCAPTTQYEQNAELNFMEYEDLFDIGQPPVPVSPPCS